MSARAAQPPPPAAAAEVWARIDRLVRVTTPAVVEALGFASVAARMRALSDFVVVDPASLRAASRDLCAAVNDDYLVTHRAVLALRDAGGDELEYLRERQISDERGDAYIRASGLIANALEIIPGWATEGHGLTFERRLEIASLMVTEAEYRLHSYTRAYTVGDMSKATKHGKVDGMVDGTLGKSCDPTGAFIKRRDLVEADRAAHNKAYNAAYRGAVRS